MFGNRISVSLCIFYFLEFFGIFCVLFSYMDESFTVIFGLLVVVSNQFMFC